MNNACLSFPDYCTPRQKHHWRMPREARGSSVGDHARLEPRVRPGARARGQNTSAQSDFKGRAEPPVLIPGPDFPRHFRISYLCLHLSLAHSQKALLPSVGRSILPLQTVLGQQSSFSSVGKNDSLALCAGSAPCLEGSGQFRVGGGLEGKGRRLVRDTPAKCGSCMGDSSRK